MPVAPCQLVKRWSRLSSFRRRPRYPLIPSASLHDKAAPYAWIDHARLTFTVSTGVFHERKPRALLRHCHPMSLRLNTLC
jgi:hypothetical protein